MCCSSLIVFNMEHWVGNDYGEQANYYVFYNINAILYMKPSYYRALISKQFSLKLTQLLLSLLR